jgi:hypothetical protein
MPLKIIKIDLPSIEKEVKEYLFSHHVKKDVKTKQPKLYP